MIRKILILMLFNISLLNVGFGQNVGINASGTAPNASAMLDVESTTRGLLIPRVSLTAANNNAPIGAGVATSLLVYNTNTAGTGATAVSPGYYYWDGSKWVALAGPNGKDWALEGNAGTTPPSVGYGSTINNNFLGTTDAQDLTFATNSLERMRIRSDDASNLRIGMGTAFTVNLNTGSTPSLLHLHDWGTSANDFAVLNLSSQTTASGNRTGLINFAATSATNDRRSASIESYLTAASGTNVSGDLRFFTNNANTFAERLRIFSNGRVTINNTTPVAGDFVTITNNTSIADYGLNSYNTGVNGAAIYGEVSSTSNLFSGIEGATFTNLGGGGVYGTAFGTTGAGVLGEYYGNNAAGIGIIGSYLGTANSGVRLGILGSSLRGSGNQQFGVVGTYNASAWGAGIYGLGAGGGYVAGNNDFAVVGWRANNANFSGYFNGNHVIANGTKSGSVPTTKGNQLLYVTETPEVWFEDIGSGKLINGEAIIQLDPLFLETVVIDEKHPMHVFIQMEGESNDVYVIKGTSEFKVKEKNNGNSSAQFSYRIMAKRIHFQDHRFGNDPVWGPGDTRKYSQYAPPPPIDYFENIKFQEEQKKNWVKPPMPEGFVWPDQLPSSEKKYKTKETQKNTEEYK